jgi:hypothetical protein
MHFIEALFHVSPDAGSGMTEAMFLAVPIVICVLLVMRRIKRSQRRAL